MQNFLIEMQTQLASLLAAHSHFDGVPILTEQLADLAAQVEKAILSAGGYGAVVTTARGQRHGAPDDTELTPLVLTEEIAVSIIHAPLLAPERRALDGVFAAIEALDMKPSLQPLFPWRVLGHNHDPAASGAIVHHVRVSAHYAL